MASCPRIIASNTTIVLQLWTGILSQKTRVCTICMCSNTIRDKRCQYRKLPTNAASCAITACATSTWRGHMLIFFNQNTFCNQYLSKENCVERTHFSIYENFVCVIQKPKTRLSEEATWCLHFIQKTHSLLGSGPPVQNQAFFLRFTLSTSAFTIPHRTFSYWVTWVKWVDGSWATYRPAWGIARVSKLWIKGE